MEKDASKNRFDDEPDKAVKKSVKKQEELALH